MSSASEAPADPDLSAGIDASAVPDGSLLLGHVGVDAVIVARIDGRLSAIGATCSHYGGPLAEGLIVGDTVRCPWHHACFSLRTGEALRAPAIDPVACYSVTERDGRITVGEKSDAAPRSAYTRPVPPLTAGIVIIGAGAAGVAAAEMLRRCGYRGPLTMLDQLSTPPVDRPNLSKDYLAGTAEAEWVKLRPDEFYPAHDITLRLDTRAASIDVQRRRVISAGQTEFPFDRLLIATGATPVRLPIPGADLPHVHYLRTLDDSNAIIDAARQARHVVVIGASFIGLEVAASLTIRGHHVDVLGPDSLPLERVLGPELGRMVQKLHADHGVTFHLGTHASSISAESVQLVDGTTLPADLVVVGVGVRPDVSLARDAGLTVDDGVVVSAQLETSAPGIYAAGDIASWPDPRAGRIRVEHWVHAERQGQVAARNMLGANEAFTHPPFFWSQHYDARINYAGRAPRDAQRSVTGDPMAQDCDVRYTGAGGVLAADAEIGRDRASLEAELALERMG